MERMDFVDRDAAALLGEVEWNRVEMPQECWVDLATRKASKLWVWQWWHRPSPLTSESHIRANACRHWQGRQLSLQKARTSARSTFKFPVNNGRGLGALKPVRTHYTPYLSA